MADVIQSEHFGERPVKQELWPPSGETDRPHVLSEIQRLYIASNHIFYLLPIPQGSQARDSLKHSMWPVSLSIKLEESGFGEAAKSREPKACDKSSCTTINTCIIMHGVGSSQHSGNKLTTP